MSAGGRPTANVRVWSDSQPSCPPTRSAMTVSPRASTWPFGPLPIAGFGPGPHSGESE